eukprot:2990835-Pyramimonas_sp.AAC.1
MSRGTATESRQGGIGDRGARRARSTGLRRTGVAVAKAGILPDDVEHRRGVWAPKGLSLIHISEPTRPEPI